MKKSKKLLITLGLFSILSLSFVPVEARPMTPNHHMAPPPMEHHVHRAYPPQHNSYYRPAPPMRVEYHHHSSANGAIAGGIIGGLLGIVIGASL